MPARQSSWTSNTSSPRRPAREDRECRVSGCKKIHCFVKVDDKKIYSKYCFRHTCFRRLPVKDGFFCNTHIKKGEKFCLHHLTCAADGCRHTGCYDDVETHEDDTHPWYCPYHRCGHDGCKSGIHDLLSKSCKEHQLCAAPDCKDTPDHDSFSQYCKTHTCLSGGGTCSLQATADNRCREHTKCNLAPCPQPCHRTPTGRLEFLCEIHLLTKCARSGCGRNKLHVGRRYCLDHGCRVPDCTGERHPGGGTLCADHKCTFDHCYSPTIPPSEAAGTAHVPLFCATHACRHPSCLFSRHDPSSYCLNHQCRLPTCLNSAALGPGSFCNVHALGRPGGPESDVGTQTSVGFEQCRAGACRVIVPMGGYCKGHVCVEDGCGRARLGVHLAGTGEDVEGLARCLGHEREVWMGKGREEGRKESRDGRHFQVMVEDDEDAEDESR